MDRFDEMRMRGTSSASGGGGGGTTGILPQPVSDFKIHSIAGERGTQYIRFSFPDDATSVEVLLKEGSYPLATNDVFYQRETFEYGEEHEIQLKSQANGTYPYKLYAWAISKNNAGTQTVVTSQNRAELNVYYASNTWDETSLDAISGISSNVNATIDGNLVFINTSAGILLLDRSENTLKMLVTGAFTEKPTVLNPRSGVYLIKSGSWYEYNVGSDTTTLLSDLGTNNMVGEYGGYYFFNININYKKSTGGIVTSCANALTYFGVTSKGVFCFKSNIVTLNGTEITIRRLNLSTMSYDDVCIISHKHYEFRGGWVIETPSGAVYITIRYDSTSSMTNMFASWRFDGTTFVGASLPSGGQLAYSTVMNFDLCGLGTNLLCRNTSAYVQSGIFRDTGTGLELVANSSVTFKGGVTSYKTINTSKETITLTFGSDFMEYRYYSSTNTIYRGSTNRYYGTGADDTTHSTIGTSDLGTSTKHYLGYHNGKHWRYGLNGIYYLRDDGYWQRIKYDTLITDSYEMKIIDDEIYWKNSNTVICRMKLETDAPIESITYSMTGKYDVIDFQKVNGLIYFVPRSNAYLSATYTNFSDYIKIYNPADRTVTTSETLRGGIAWGENKYLSLNDLQISNIRTGEVEKVPSFNATRIITDSLNNINAYNGLSIVMSHSGTNLSLMYAG